MATYAYTGQIQRITVQTTGRYDISAYGGGGGSGSYKGGAGAQVGGDFNLTAGEKLEIVAGGAGKSGYTGGGGGASEVFGSTGGGAYVPLLVAGGGGGGGNGASDGGSAGGNATGYGGSGLGGRAGNGSGSGGGGAGVKSDGGTYGNGGSGGRDLADGATGGNSGGGFSGGGGHSNGAGGGGGYTGGGGGIGQYTKRAGNYILSYGGGGGAGGTSFDGGTAIAAQTKLGTAATHTGSGSVTLTMVCYATGTAIRVWRNGAPAEAAVEDLVVGDPAVTASGAHRPIRWLGSRTLDCRRHLQPGAVLPVRIAAHAFGTGKPARDLYVSPEHSLCVDVIDSVLIPAGKLINGSTIAQVEVETVTYWHVELDSHDILLAENMPAESFLEMGANRALLGLPSEDITDEVLGRSHADFCCPFVDSGPVLDTVRLQLAARAERLGWTPVRDPGLAGFADGARVHPQIAGGEAFFAVPDGTRELRLRSAERVPTAFGEADPRRLGLAVYALALSDGCGVTHALDLDGPELRACFHEGERREGLHYRWTNGDLVIPAALLAGHAGPLMLRVSFEPSTVRGWTAPAPEPAALPPALRAVA